MKEVIVIFSVLSIYSLISYLVYLVILKAKIWICLLSWFGYLVFTKYYFEVIIYSHQSLRARGIYFEFGHAEIELIAVFGLCILLAVLFTITAVIKRYKRIKMRKKLANEFS